MNGGSGAIGAGLAAGLLMVAAVGVTGGCTSGAAHVVTSNDRSGAEPGRFIGRRAVAADDAAVSSVFERRRLAPTPVSGPVEGIATLGAAARLPGTGTDLVPFAVEERRGLFGSDDGFAARGSASSIGGTVLGRDAVFPLVTAANAATLRPVYAFETRWHNGIFRDAATGESWTLLGSRGVVTRVEAYVPSVDPPAGMRPAAIGVAEAARLAETGLLTKEELRARLATLRDEQGQAGGEARPLPMLAYLFTASVEDTNGDGIIASDDAEQVFATDGRGRGARPILPPRCRVLRQAYDRDTATLDLLLVIDEDRDGVFGLDDATAPYRFVVGGGGVAEPVVEPAGGAAARAAELLGR